MNDNDLDPRQQVNRTFLHVVLSTDVSHRQGEAKPLRPQTRRFAKEERTRRLERRYHTAHAFMIVTLILWSIIPQLPQAAPPLDMRVVSACLYTLTLATLIAGLANALAMVRPEPLPQTI